MGVPAFFKKLSSKYRVTQSSTDNQIKSLYIDSNCLFHPQCFTILNMYKDLIDQKKLFKKMAKRITDYIDYLIQVTQPTDLVYIAVDGVAPVAKINQQRSRRFGYANNYRNEIYKKHNIAFNDSWSNIVITPATEWMYELHLYLLKYYKQKASENSFKIIYDSYLTDGEGEHKILQHIKSTDDENDDAIVIYGLDADLIFLAMASQRQNVYLLRETQHFGTKKQIDETQLEQELLYVNIDYVKQCINNDFNDDYHDFLVKNNICKNKRHDVQQFDFINDYIFICYFLGNDFLPHLPSIDINSGGLEMLLNTYMLVFQTIGKTMITYKNDKIDIDNDFLIEFIKQIADKELYFFRNIMSDNKKQYKRCYETEQYKREIWEIENLKNEKIIDHIKLGQGTTEEWKYRYYNHYFKIDDIKIDKKGKVNNEHINNLCHNYFEGLLWVAKYYFESCSSWRWQYKYTHAPFLSDLYNYLINNNINDDFIVSNDESIDMFTQLVGVLPPAFSHILPNELQHLNSSNESPIIDMYPIEYELDKINKTQLYKCIPMIPYLDITRAQTHVNEIKLSESAKKRTEKTTPFVL